MAGTIMQDSHTPLSTWFWGAYLVTTQTPGQSAVQFQRQLGLRRYETAFQILHKLRAGMVRPERDAIGSQHPVEVDETLVGGRTRAEGRGVHHKATVAGAIEVRPRPAGANGKKPKRAVYAGRLRLRLVPNRGAKTLTGFVQENVAKGAVVRTDGWQGYDELAALGYSHEPMVLDGDPERTDATPADDPYRLLEPQGLVARHTSRSQSSTSTSLPQRIFVPVQPAFLSNDCIQLCPGSRVACFSTHLRDALQW